MLRRPLLALALMLAAISTHAATLYVTEFLGAPPLSVYYQSAKAPAVAAQTVSFTSSSVQSAAFNANTGLLRIQCDAICNVVVGGTNPVATTSSMRLTAGQTEYFVVTAGDKVAVIAGT